MPGSRPHSALMASMRSGPPFRRPSWSTFLDGRAALCITSDVMATLPRDRQPQVGVAALFWEWLCATDCSRRTKPRRGLESASKTSSRMPAGTGSPASDVHRHDLDYDRMRENRVHSLRNPNTSFREERARGEFNPVGRWQTGDLGDRVQLCEALVGPVFESSASLAGGFHRLDSASAIAMRAVYLPVLRVEALAEGAHATRQAVDQHERVGRATSRRRQAARADSRAAPEQRAAVRVSGYCRVFDTRSSPPRPPVRNSGYSSIDRLTGRSAPRSARISASVSCPGSSIRGVPARPQDHG